MRIYRIAASIVLICATAGCGANAPTDGAAEDALILSGFRSPVIGDWRACWPGYGREFRATAPNGRPVSGTVCNDRGLFDPDRNLRISVSPASRDKNG